MDALISSLPPTGVLLVALLLAREKVNTLNATVEKLVGAVDTLRLQLGEVAVLRVEVEHCKSEISAVRERSHDLSNEVSALRVQIAGAQR